MTEVQRSADCGNSPKNAKVEDIALALMGVGDLADDLIAEAATWDRPGTAVMGHDKIRETASAQHADRITVDQVVSHGKAGTVSGRISRAGKTSLFCHVIRFTTASAKQVAQLVSFEHPEAHHYG